jgi:hypothetical protein
VVRDISESLLYEDRKQWRWTGSYGGGQDPHRVIASVKNKFVPVLN